MNPVVALNDFRMHWREIRSAALCAIDAVGNSGRLILAENVKRFEETLAARALVKHAIGCASGLDAIEISLRVLGLKPGDRVLTTPLSAFATTLAVLRAGGIPVFVDVDDSGLLDLKAAEKILSEAKKPIRFLLPVHLFGHAIELRRLALLKKRFPVGTVGDMSAISLYPTKNLGCMGDGGAILTGDDEFAAESRALRDYGQTERYAHVYFGMNSRLDEIQAAILVEALMPRLAEFTRRRREIASLYRQNIISGALTVPAPPQGSDSVYHLFPVLVPGNREGFQEHLRSRGIETGVHYPALIPSQAALRGREFEVANGLRNALRFANCEVSLPIHPYLSDCDVERVIDACNTWQMS
jgi:dTDP-4-amino-4,6-dideoxygalactose transaminase